MFKTKSQYPSPVNKSKYTYFEAIIYSFFSQDLYVDVGLRWKGFGLLYLVLLSCIAAIPLVTKQYIEQQRLFNERLIPVVKQLPSLNIEKGKIKTTVKLPFIIKDATTNEPAIVIKKEASQAFIEKTPAYIVITQNAIYSRLLGSDKLQKTALNSDAHGELNAQSLLKILYKLKRYFLFLTYPLFSMSTFGMQATCLFVFCFLGTVFSKIVLKFPLKYGMSVRLGMVSCTPELLIFSLVYSLDLFSQKYNFLIFLVFIFYYIFAIRSVKHSMRQMVVV